MKIFFRAVSSALLLFFGVFLVEASAFGSKPKALPTLEEKIGQLIVVGFQGYEVNDELRSYIKDYKIGGVILFNRGIRKDRVYNVKDPKQLEKLLKDLKKLDKTLFITVDQEGGKVMRLRADNGFMDVPTPSAYDMAKLDDKEFYEESIKIAKLLKKYGINVNFAPVVDIDNKNNPVIGGLDRAFSSDVNNIYHFANLHIKAHHDNGIITSIKHFPGHGSSLSDSHLGAVDVTKTWSERELVPYKRLISEGGYNDMVMVAHIFNAHIDSVYPSSLSKQTIDGILRKKLKYDGVVATDSLDMGAITKNYTLKETIITTLDAGSDLLVFGNNSPDPYDGEIVMKIHKIIKDAIKSGEIEEARIDEAYNRVINLKKRYNIKN